MNVAYQPDGQRIPRFLGSCFWIGLGFAAIETADKPNESRTLAALLYSIYLISCAILMVAIISRLYRQHEIRRMRFDLANLILVTTLIALPFAISNIFWEMFGLDHVKELANDKTNVLIIGAGILAFLMFPVFFVVEAILSWASLLFGKMQRNRDGKMGG
jgi:hypothetical protein